MNKQPFYGCIQFRRRLATDEKRKVLSRIKNTPRVLKDSIEFAGPEDPELLWTATACVCDSIRNKIQRVFGTEIIMFDIDTDMGCCEPGDPADLM